MVRIEHLLERGIGPEAFSGRSPKDLIAFGDERPRWQLRPVDILRRRDARAGHGYLRRFFFRIPRM